MEAGDVDVRSLLFGSKLRVVGVVLLVLVAAVVVAFLAGLVGTPAVVGVENRFGPVSQEETVVYTDLVVNNPNPAGVTLDGTTVNYTVRMNEVAIAGGQKQGLAIQPGNTTLQFETAMRNGKIPRWWYTHVSPDYGGGAERTVVTIDGTVRDPILPDRAIDIRQEQTVETDLIGQFNSDEERPIDANAPVVSDPILVVRETSASWGEVTPERTPVDMGFRLHNPKTTPFTVTEIGYEISMNDVQVGEGASERALVIPGGETRTLETRTTINNTRLDDWWVSHMQRNQVTQLRIDFYAKIELPTGTIRVPLDEMTYEKTIETDIFGNKDDSAPERSGDGGGSDAGSGGSDGGDDATTTTSGNDGTDATTTTTTATTTEDDGLFSVTASPSRSARSATSAVD